jgi:hypothetical protein
VAKWLTRWSAKPVFAGSIPARCSIISITYGKSRKALTPLNTTEIKYEYCWRPAMLKKTVDRYQHGSVRKVRRAQGFAWEFRYYVMEESMRKPKVQTFDSAIYKTEKALR